MLTRNPTETLDNRLEEQPIADGQIVEQAPPDQLFTQPSDERTRRFLRRIVDAGRI